MPGTTEATPLGDHLEIKDSRTGKIYTVSITDDTIRTADLRQIKVKDNDFGMMGYDPAFMNTASCRSSITYIDGDQGILRYRGYPIDQLAEKASFLEVAWLLRHGELPTQAEHDQFTHDITFHTYVHENIKQFMEGFRYDAHPMAMMTAGVAALSSFYPTAKNVHDPRERDFAFIRLLAKMPTIAAFAYRHVKGMPYVYPDNSLPYAENFLSMIARMSEPRYEAHPIYARAIDILFILHADHEQNCSTSTMRNVGSSHADPYASTASALGALYGPLHGGANEAVLRMLAQIGTVDRVPEFIKQVKSHQALLMGFGHRIYKSYDPRARIIKKTADQVFAVTGLNPLLEIAVELERIALQDEYFVSRKLYPNVDFYSGLIYQAMGIPSGMFTVLFGIGRTAGWLAQWDELVQDPDQKIARPRQIYVGPTRRDFVPIAERG